MRKLIVILTACIVLAVAAALWFLRTPDRKLPQIYNPAGLVSEAEIHQIEQLVRDKGERSILCILITSTNKADVTTRPDGYEPRRGRAYTVSRTEDGWRIDAVEEVRWKK